MVEININISNFIDDAMKKNVITTPSIINKSNIQLTSHHHHLIPGSPLVFGPGTWWLIHLKSYLTDTEDKIEHFYKFLYTIVYNIPCHTCRRNAIEYISTNDGSKYVNIRHKGRHIGMFMWMVDFHNEVNKRNNKDVIDRSEVYNAYKSDYPEKHPIIPESPLIFGPGAWWVLHLLSYAAKEDKDIEQFIKFVKEMIPRIPCPMCRHNAQKYMGKNGSTLNNNIIYDDKNVGVYVWISDLHNDVNNRNEQSIIDWKYGYQKYKEVFNTPDTTFINHINKMVSKLRIKK